MSDTDRESESSGSKNVPMRWRADEWATLERAASAFAEREHMRRTTPTDVIRSGAMRRAEEILAEAENTAADRRDGPTDRRTATV